MRSTRSGRVFGGVALFLSLLFFGCSPADRPDDGPAIALSGVTVIDGTGGQPLLRQTLLLKGGRIAAVGATDEVQLPSGTDVWNLAGHYVVPGFVDLHVHFPEDGSVHQAMLSRLLEYGVTTLLNPGARPGAGVELRERIARGELKGPRMFAAGRIIDHSPTLPDFGSWAAQVTTEEAIRAEVAAQAALDVDFVKFYRHLPRELLAAGVSAAHEAGLPVVGHMGDVTWNEAARMGVEMLVHSGWGTPMDEVITLDDPESASDTDWYRAYADAAGGERLASLISTLIAHDVVVVPTLSITQASGLGADATLLPLFQVELAPDAEIADWWTPGWRTRHPQYEPDSKEEAEAMARYYWPGVLGILAAYHEAGVRLAVGTDVGNSWMTPGVVFHHELGLYQDAGIPPLDILTMASRNGAEALGILADTGTIEVGKRADLVILGSDPLEDIRNTRDIRAVIAAGRIVASPEGVAWQ